MEIGEKIRSLRLQKKLSLKDISEKTGFTKSVISQIERGISNPSIKSLKKIAESLESPVSYFFDEKIPSNPVVKRNKRMILRIPMPGIIYELLSPNFRTNIELIYSYYDVGASSSNELISHAGEECCILIKGKMKININDEIYILEEGDSIYFESTKPHRYQNAGNEPAEFIFAIWPNPLLIP